MEEVGEKMKKEMVSESFLEFLLESLLLVEGGSSSLGIGGVKFVIGGLYKSSSQVIS